MVIKCVKVIVKDRTQYGLFQDAVALSQSKDEESWKKAQFWVFDVPSLKDKPFEVRKSIK